MPKSWTNTRPVNLNSSKSTPEICEVYLKKLPMRWLITGFVAVLMIYCLITKQELFPFAPYTMYCERYKPENMREYKIFLKKNDQEPVEITAESRNLIQPFDEARIKVSIKNAYFKSTPGALNSPEVRKKAKEILKLINYNSNAGYTSINIGIYMSKDLQELRAGKKIVVEQINEQLD